MILHICAVFDSASQAYGRPIFAAAKGHAMRSFKDEVLRADPNNDLHNHPEDFTLFYLGFFDDNTGVINAMAPEQLLRGLDVQTMGK